MGESTFGPAFLLGGTAKDFTQGLYNALGRLIGAGKTASAQSAAVASAGKKEREEALRTAAAKIDDGDVRGGRAIAERLVDKNGGDITALRLVGHSHLVEQNYKQAERYYARAAALAPQDARVRGELNNARALQGNDDDVLSKARRMIKSPARRTDGLRLLSHLSDRSPDNLDAYLALADGFSAARKPLQVIGALQEAVQVANDQRIDEVITRTEALADAHPRVGLPRNILGRALRKAGRLDASIRELKAASDIAAYNTSYRLDLADAHVARGLAKLSSGSVSAALTDLGAARSIDPGHAGLREADARVAAHRAEGFIMTGLHDRAFTELNAADAKSSDDLTFRRQVSALYLRLGAHFRQKGTDASALTSYTRAYELDGGSLSARHNVGELSHSEGLDAIARADYDAAITHLERAYETYRANTLYKQDLARAYDLRGQLRRSTGKTADALADFKRGAGLDPSNTSLSANLAAALA